MSESARRVLVVSDDPETGAIVRDVVAGHGYTAQLATNSQATAARLTAARPDLIVLDMFTPLLHEWPILDNLLRMSKPPPLVALTSRCLSPNALAAVTFHGRGHLKKPFEPTTLIQLCERWTTRAAADEPGHSERPRTAAGSPLAGGLDRPAARAQAAGSGSARRSAWEAADVHSFDLP